MSTYTRKTSDEWHVISTNGYTDSIEGVFTTQGEARACLEDLREHNSKKNVIYLLKKRRKWENKE